MFEAIRNVLESFATPPTKKVFFPSLSFNRKLLFWYADRVVGQDSVVENVERLREIEELRLNGKAVTFICNHLTYADSHVIETLMMRSGFSELADHLIHIAGQKTYEISRRFMTRSLNTIRVYQPKADVNPQIRKRMNFRALKWGAHLKCRGYSLLVFPEGTRTRRHRRFNLHSANPKVTIYFRHSYVVPLALMGAERIMPVGKFWPQPAIVTMRIGEPSDFKETEWALRSNHPEWSDSEIRCNLIVDYMTRINDLLDPDYRDKTEPLRPNSGSN